MENGEVWVAILRLLTRKLCCAGYQTHHTLAFPPKPNLQKSINAYLSAFTRAETGRNRLRARQRAVPDEDGFITVVRGGRTGPARLEEAEAAKEKLEERKKKRGAKEDFYRFQVREKRKEREGELRRKFEQDRRKVADMRERRGRVVVSRNIAVFPAVEVEHLLTVA